MLVFSRKRDLFLFPHNHKTILVSGGGGGGQELEKSIIKKFKEQTKPDRSKRFQRSLIKKKKLVIPQNNCKDNRTLNGTVRLHTKKNFYRRDPLKQLERNSKYKYAEDNLEKDFAYWTLILWSDETTLELFSHREAVCLK